MTVLQHRIATLILAATGLFGQTADRFLGTVETVSPALRVRGEKEAVTVKPAGDVLVQKVAPGERDLAKAQVVVLGDLAAGDRVLLRGQRTGEEFSAKSIILMSAREIAQRNDQEREEWNQRGVAGVVEAVDAKAGTMVVTVREAGAAKPLTVDVRRASFKRYASDSVRFADAKESSLAEVKKGDQVRALGTASKEGAAYVAQRVVFGTFRSLAGEIVAIREAEREVDVKDQQSGRLVTLVVKSGTQMKRAGMPGMGMMGRGPVGPGGGPGGPGPGPGGGPGMRAPDLGRMMERMPTAALSEFRAGEVILASASAGEPGKATAIVLLGNAGFLLQILTGTGGRNEGQRPNGPGAQGPGFGNMGGLDALMGPAIFQ